MRVLSYLTILLSSFAILFFTLNYSRNRLEDERVKFSYRDGLFYEKNSDEPFTGRIIDTSNVIVEFEVMNGKKNGRFICYFIEGGIEKEGMILNEKNEGLWKYYYGNGQLQTSGNFRNNLPDGEWISYHSSGEISIIGNYRNGLQSGLWSYFDESGNLINSMSYINNFLKEKIFIFI